MIDHGALELLRKVDDRYAHFSGHSRHFADPEFKAVIARGPALIPTLVYAITEPGKQGHGVAPWLSIQALHVLTGEWPAREEDAGRLTAILGAWRVWAIERGITPEDGHVELRLLDDEDMSLVCRVYRGHDGKLCAKNASGAIEDAVREWNKNGLHEWVGDREAPSPRHTPPDHPVFLSRLAAYIQRQPPGLRAILRPIPPPAPEQ